MIKKRLNLFLVIRKEPAKIRELINLAEFKDDFNEEDIIERNKMIISKFVSYLDSDNLLS